MHGKKKTPHDYFLEFQARFLQYSDDELINVFNAEVGNDGWASVRGSYLAAIHREFDRRKFDYSAIGDSQSLSFKNKVSLVKCLKVLK